MSVSIHPHTGYLNTLFHVHVSGTDDVEYRVLLKLGSEDKEILKGKVSPHEPFSLKLPVPGKFSIECSDGTTVPLTIKDGYRFGGGKFKRAFVFDTCPWLFIIMHDRTYFYNRRTKESYIESLSPDTISEISKDYVIFGNNNHSERTIYSLNEQKPILNITGILYHNEQNLIWKEDDELIVFSFKTHNIMTRISPRQYLIWNNQLLYAIENTIYSIDLRNDFQLNKMLEWENDFCAFIDNIYSVYSFKRNEMTELQIVNHVAGELVKTIVIDGTLASVNGHEIINVHDRKRSLRNLDLSKIDFPEASIIVRYFDFIFYPCDWDIYYLKQISTFTKTLSHFYNEEEIVLMSINTEMIQEWCQFEDNETMVTDARFLIFNQNESFVRCKSYSAAGYNNSGRVRVHKDLVILEGEHFIYTLSKNGYWDNRIKRKYTFEKFVSYGIVFDKETELYRSFLYNIKGKELLSSKNPTSHVILGDAAILPGGKIFFKKSELSTFSNNPIAISPNFTLGLEINKLSGRVYLVSIESGKEEREEILSGIYDNSCFKSVLFSEDGKQILYRNSQRTEIRDVKSNEIVSFDNLSYVEQTNGIRPMFRQASSLQPRIINPVTGLLLDSKLLKKFNFISPNGLYYAGTLRDMYTEHFFIETGKVIPEDEYERLVKCLTYPSEEKKDTPEWDMVTLRRIKFIKENFTHINSSYSKLTQNSKKEDEWKDLLIDAENKNGVLFFISRVIDIRGIALIKQMSDDAVVAKIDLGKPLSYINYLSFSYDSRYVSLAGYRDFTHGLFLIYDLQEKKTICHITTNRAVWITAFSSKNAIAAYTSSPNTIFINDIYECLDKECSDHILKDRNFLTFSPDGSLMALSNQGYISKYDINGEVRSEWGHQPSTKIYISNSEYPNEIKLCFTDLGDVGVEGVSDRYGNCPKSVASVAFSNDNSRLMMVGKDGVVVIRNLHLENNACE